MKCPKCGGYLKNFNTRNVPDGRTRRRRECQNCGSRYTTYEAYVPIGMKPTKDLFIRMQGGRKKEANDGIQEN